ncbi:MAG: TetR/AcrR family transcriptional regulator [Phycisphaeraceae bacterium]|nr:TetR/AcrR family transcriptional regulator [Phycisphaeraceae bacterium]
MSNANPHTARQLFGSNEPPANTRDRIVHTALELFYVHGYHAVGLDQIIAGAGVTKTTFYNHFESKDDLIVASLQRRDQWETASFQQRVRERAGDDPAAQLLAMFDVLDEYFTHPDYHGCMFLNACSEFPSPFDPIHQTAAAHFHKSEDAVADLAERAGIADTAGFAQQWITLMQGATARRYVSRDDQSARTIRHAAETLLEKHLAAAVKAPARAPKSAKR